MQVATDYIRHAARAARKCAGDPLGGAPIPPDAEFYKALAKALEEIAAGLEQVGKGRMSGTIPTVSEQGADSARSFHTATTLCG